MTTPETIAELKRPLADTTATASNITITGYRDRHVAIEQHQNIVKLMEVAPSLLSDLEAAQRRLDHEAVMATRYANEAGALEGQLDDARKREQVLRKALEKIMVGACPSSVNAQRLADNLEAVCHEVYDISRAALAATEGK